MSWCRHHLHFSCKQTHSNASGSADDINSADQVNGPTQGAQLNEPFFSQGDVGDRDTAGSDRGRHHGLYTMGRLCGQPYKNQHRDELLSDMAPTLPCPHPLQCEPHLPVEGGVSGVQTVSSTVFTVSTFCSGY